MVKGGNLVVPGFDASPWIDGAVPSGPALNSLPLSSTVWPKISVDERLYRSPATGSLSNASEVLSMLRTMRVTPRLNLSCIARRCGHYLRAQPRGPATGFPSCASTEE